MDTLVIRGSGGDSIEIQPKALETPIQIAGQTQTEVEGAISALNSSKADKVTGATNGNLASLDASGNLADSGKKASDFMADGTVGVSKGGTGATSLTSGAALIGNGTSAVGTRDITNNTARTTTPVGSTNLVTMNSLINGMKNYLNRDTAVDGTDTNYSTKMARAIYAGTSDMTAGSSALTSGTIYIVYE